MAQKKQKFGGPIRREMAQVADFRNESQKELRNESNESETKTGKKFLKNLSSEKIQIHRIGRGRHSGLESRTNPEIRD